MFACHVEHCPRAFTLGSTYSSFLTHVTRKHPNWKEILDQAPPITRAKPHNSQPPLLPLEPQGDLENGHVPPDDDDPMEFDTPEWPTDRSDDDISDARKAAGRFLLALKERYRLSQTTVDFTVGAVNQIISIVYEDLRKSVIQSLNDIGVPTQDICIDHLFSPENIFEELETEYQQTKFYKDHFGLVVSSVQQS